MTAIVAPPIGAVRPAATTGPIRMCSSESAQPVWRSSDQYLTGARRSRPRIPRPTTAARIRGGWPRGSSLRSARGRRSSRWSRTRPPIGSAGRRELVAAGPEAGKAVVIFCDGWQSLGFGRVGRLDLNDLRFSLIALSTTWLPRCASSSTRSPTGPAELGQVWGADLVADGVATCRPCRCSRWPGRGAGPGAGPELDREWGREGSAWAAPRVVPSTPRIAAAADPNSIRPQISRVLSVLRSRQGPSAALRAIRPHDRRTGRAGRPGAERPAASDIAGRSTGPRRARAPRLRPSRFRRARPGSRPSSAPKSRSCR